MLKFALKEQGTDSVRDFFAFGAVRTSSEVMEAQNKAIMGRFDQDDANRLVRYALIIFPDLKTCWSAGRLPADPGVIITAREPRKASQARAVQTTPVIQPDKLVQESFYMDQHRAESEVQL
ncbi:MAG: hypothetical protein ABIH87_02660 [bacterium]